MNENKRLVNSWNEWDPLEEIVVGIADFACFEPQEPGNKPKLRNSKLAAKIPFPCGPKSAESINKANEEFSFTINLSNDEFAHFLHKILTINPPSSLST